jgi:hypothetical protein
MNNENSMSRSGALLASILVLVGGATGCSDEAGPLEPGPDDAATVLSVSPQGGSSGVDVGASVTIAFSHAMVDGAEQFCVVHVGGVDSPQVPGHWEWSDDHHTAAFMPDQPLAHGQRHTLHIGGGMVDEHGHVVDIEEHGPGMGGMWVQEGMMGPNGMMGGSGMTGPGWRHHNGSFGMMFKFETEM